MIQNLVTPAPTLGTPALAEALSVPAKPIEGGQEFFAVLNAPFAFGPVPQPDVPKPLELATPLDLTSLPELTSLSEFTSLSELTNSPEAVDLIAKVELPERIESTDDLVLVNPETFFLPQPVPPSIADPQGRPIAAEQLATSEVSAQPFLAAPELLNTTAEPELQPFAAAQNNTVHAAVERPKPLELLNFEIDHPRATPFKPTKESDPGELAPHRSLDIDSAPLLHQTTAKPPTVPEPIAAQSVPTTAALPSADVSPIVSVVAFPESFQPQHPVHQAAFQFRLQRSAQDPFAGHGLPVKPAQLPKVPVLAENLVASQDVEAPPQSLKQVVPTLAAQPQAPEADSNPIVASTPFQNALKPRLPHEALAQEPRPVQPSDAQPLVTLPMVIEHVPTRIANPLPVPDRPISAQPVVDGNKARDRPLAPQPPSHALAMAISITPAAKPAQIELPVDDSVFPDGLDAKALPLDHDRMVPQTALRIDTTLLAPAHEPGRLATAPHPAHQAAAALVQGLGDGAARIDLVLTPEDLGSVRFDMQPKGNDMIIVLSAERPETLELMRRHLPELMTELRQAGYAGGSFSFGQWDNRGKGQSTPRRESYAETIETPTSEHMAHPIAARKNSTDQGLNLRL